MRLLFVLGEIAANGPANVPPVADPIDGLTSGPCLAVHVSLCYCSPACVDAIMGGSEKKKFPEIVVKRSGRSTFLLLETNRAQQQLLSLCTHALFIFLKPGQSCQCVPIFGVCETSFLQGPKISSPKVCVERDTLARHATGCSWPKSKFYHTIACPTKGVRIVRSSDAAASTRALKDMIEFIFMRHYPTQHKCDSFFA